MKKSIITLLLLVSLLLLVLPANATGPITSGPVQLMQADASGLTLRLAFNAYQLRDDQVDGVSCQRLTLPDGIGAVYPVLLGAPPTAQVTATIQPLATAPLNVKGPLCSDLERKTVASASSGSNVAVRDQGYMRSQRIVRLEIPTVQRDEVTGQPRLITSMQVQVTFTGGEPGTALAEPTSFESLLQELLVNYDQARSFRARPNVTIPAGTGVWTPPTPAWRILVKEPGIYQLTYQDLRDAGLPVDSLDPHTLKLFNFGKELAITVTGEADSRLDITDALIFYGRGVDTRYTDVNVYWLTYGHGDGKRISEQRSSSGAPLAGQYRASMRLEDNLYYVPSLPMANGHDHWFGSRITVSGHNNTAYRDFTFDVTDPAPGTYEAQLTLVLGGNMTANHHLRVSVNNTELYEHTWFGRTLYEDSIIFSQNLLHPGPNTMRLEFVNDAPNQVADQIYVDWLKLDYHRKLLAQANTLNFDNPTNSRRTFQIDNFTTADLELYDISDASNVQRITGWQAIDMGDGHYRLQFGDTATEPRQYWAQAITERRQPLDIQKKPFRSQPLASAENGADYLIIYHPDFSQAIQPLIDLRSNQGYRVMAVSTQDVYDEFGYGMMSAEAIHEFLAYAYARWQRPAPTFVLLVGDGTYDFRHYLSSSAKTYLPPYLAVVDPTLGETATDNRFVTLTEGDILPEMHIGRLPANSATETTAMVDKILTYENTSADASWTRNILFVTDNLEGGGGNFYELSDAIADGYIDPPANTTKLIPELYHRQKLYLDRNCSSGPDCRQKMANYLDNEGALFVSFIGHGTKTFWARERIWDVTSASQMRNGSKLPIMLPMTCNEGYFHEAATTAQSTSEAAVRLAGNGAIASWAPTGYGLSSGHDYLERGFFYSVFHGFGRRLGPATTAGKLYLVATAPPGSYSDLIDTFLLMGDPALKLPLASTPHYQQMYLPIVIKE